MIAWDCLGSWFAALGIFAGGFSFAPVLHDRHFQENAIVRNDLKAKRLEQAVDRLKAQCRSAGHDLA